MLKFTKALCNLTLSEEWGCTLILQVDYFIYGRGKEVLGGL